FLHKEALENHWLVDENAELLTERGTQVASLSYPHLSHSEIFQSVDDFYKRFYFRAPKIAAIVGEMVTSPEMLRRRLREGVEFFRFLRERREPASCSRLLSPPVILDSRAKSMMPLTSLIGTVF